MCISVDHRGIYGQDGKLLKDQLNVSFIFWVLEFNEIVVSSFYTKPCLDYTDTKSSSGYHLWKLYFIKEVLKDVMERDAVKMRVKLPALNYKDWWHVIIVKFGRWRAIQLRFWGY